MHEWGRHRRGTASAAAETGSDTALRALYARWFLPLQRYAWQGLRDEPAAQELAQDVLLRAWRHGHLDEEPGQLGPWLFTVARNLMIDQQRRARVRPRTAGAAGLDTTTEAVAEIDELVARAEILEALRALPERQRSVIVEVYYRGNTISEAAQLLGLPPGTVKSRLFYGLRVLRDNLEEMGAPP